MEALQVKWSKTARNDLRQVITYLKNRNPSAAGSLLDEIEARASTLDQLSERGRLVPELQSQGLFQFREILVSHWRVIYKVIGCQVYVLAVLDARRNLEDLLLARMFGGEL